MWKGLQIIAAEEIADYSKKEKKYKGRARKMEKPLRAEQLVKPRISREPIFYTIYEKDRESSMLCSVQSSHALAEQSKAEQRNY